MASVGTARVGRAEPPHRTHSVRIEVGDADLPEDRFSDHVNNARYFVFVNQCFRSWYVAMDIRGGVPGHTAVMVHIEYDFLREVKPPSVIECRIEVTRVGRTSMDHAISMIDHGSSGEGEPVQVGRGRAVHAWVERARGQALPWPEDVLARCWAEA